jgi:hypothetical protein
VRFVVVIMERILNFICIPGKEQFHSEFFSQMKERSFNSIGHKFMSVFSENFRCYLVFTDRAMEE